MKYIKNLFTIENISIFCIILIVIIRLVYLGIVDKSTVYLSSESGYIINKTSESCFHYIISGNDATPEFKDYYYYTMIVDDNYIKFQLPYKVFIEHQLGDHLTVYRNYNNITKEFSNYSAMVNNIKVPAIIINDEYANKIY